MKFCWPVAALSVLALSAHVAYAESIKDSRAWNSCQGVEGVWSDLRVTSCTDLIKGGKVQGEDLGKIYYYRGNAFLVKSEYRKAIEDFSRALDISKDNANALHERCWARAVLNIDLEDALSDCNQSLRIRSQDAETLGGRAFLYVRLGFYRTAIADYDAALAVKPEAPEYLFGRATAKLQAGDEDGASADFAAARNADPKIDAVFARYDEVAGGKGFWGAIAGYWRAMMKWIY